MELIFSPSMTKRQTNAFLELMDTARVLLHSNKSAEQCIVAFSDSGDIVHLLSNPIGDPLHQDGDFFDDLIASSHTFLPFILCLWRDGAPDLPAYQFRTRLRTVDPRNDDSLIFVNTDAGISFRALKTTMR